MVKILREDNEIKQIPIKCIEGATLLSAEEAEELLTQKERVCRYNGELCNWWLRTASNYYKVCAVDVISNGLIDYEGSYVDGEDDYVRPALLLTRDSSECAVGNVFEFGGYQFKIISAGISLCEEAIGQHVFCEDIDAIDANAYEKSDVKKYVDDWFKKCMQDEMDISQGIKTDTMISDENDFGF